jgi:hypothetical protein
MNYTLSNFYGSDIHKQTNLRCCFFIYLIRHRLKKKTRCCFHSVHRQTAEKLNARERGSMSINIRKTNTLIVCFFLQSLLLTNSYVVELRDNRQRLRSIYESKFTKRTKKFIFLADFGCNFLSLSRRVWISLHNLLPTIIVNNSELSEIVE